MKCPRRWDELSQEQLRMVYHVLGCNLYSSVEARTLILLRLLGIRLKKKTLYGYRCAARVMIDGKVKNLAFYIQPWQVQSMIKQLQYVDSYETMNVRLESVQGFEAVDAMLHRVMFKDYLNMEKYYQGFLQTKEHRYAKGLVALMYPGATEPDDAEVTCCVMWYSYVKLQFSKTFRHFFRPAGGKAVNWIDQMNAQIRALTDGDITKEQTVLDTDCWRALTELDAKALESIEFEKRMKRK